MEKQVFTVGDRADKFCKVCDEERGHIVTSVTKRGQISRVSCSKCETISTFQLAARTAPSGAKTPSPYDRTLTYRAGQSMTHEMFGIGEVTRLIEPQKDGSALPGSRASSNSCSRPEVNSEHRYQDMSLYV